MRKQCLFSLAHATDDDDDNEDEDDNGDDSMQFRPRVERGAREGGSGSWGSLLEDHAAITAAAAGDPDERNGSSRA